MPEPQLLRMTQIDFVGFVDEGANPEARILITKRADTGVTKALSGLPADVVQILRQRETAIEKLAGTGATRSTGAAWAEVQTIAKQFVASGSSPTEAQAIDRAFLENPELYDRYVLEVQDA